jgi:hypothetical protein
VLFVEDIFNLHTPVITSKSRPHLHSIFNSCPAGVDRHSEIWKQHIVRHAVAVTAQQRSERLVRVCNSHIDLITELANTGHHNWDLMQRPEWLLLEVESGIMMWEVQVDIADQMPNPESG